MRENLTDYLPIQTNAFTNRCSREMTSLSNKIKTAMDESRMLILGTQILLGFQYRAFFEKGFEALLPVSQYLQLVSLAILLIAIVLIMRPSAYHRIVREGNDTHDVLRQSLDDSGSSARSGDKNETSAYRLAHVSLGPRR